MNDHLNCSMTFYANSFATYVSYTFFPLAMAFTYILYVRVHIISC